MALAHGDIHCRGCGTVTNMGIEAEGLLGDVDLCLDCAETIGEAARTYRATDEGQAGTRPALEIVLSR